MDAELIRNGLMALQWLTTCALAAYTFSTNKQRATTESIDKLNERINEKCQRIAKLEAELKVLPSADKVEAYVTQIHLRINEINKTGAETNLLIGQMSGQLSEMSSRLKG